MKWELSILLFTVNKSIVLLLALEHGKLTQHLAEKLILIPWTSFGVVQQVLEDGNLRLITRTGKQHTIHPHDPNLRKATLWERWYFCGRYREIKELVSL